MRCPRCNGEWYVDIRAGRAGDIHATDVEFGLDDAKRRRAISAYYALCTMMNDQSEHLRALDDTGSQDRLS